MKSGKIDHVCDELMRLALELGYSGNFIKDKARVGINTDLRNAWALKTPLPDEYVEYINLLSQTGHQLEDVASFNRKVTREKHHFKPENRDDRQLSAKRQRKDRKSLGPRQQKPRNHAAGSSRPQETEVCQSDCEEYHDAFWFALFLEVLKTQPHGCGVSVGVALSFSYPLAVF